MAGVSYTTKDLAEAAFFWSLPEWNYISNWMEGRSVFFVFEAENLSEDDLAKICLDWKNDRVSVNPKKFFDKIQDLRQIIFNSRPRR